MRDVPLPQRGERRQRRLVAQGGQPRVEVALHAVLEDARAIRILSAGVVEATARIPVEQVVVGLRGNNAGNHHRIHDRRALRAQHCDHLIHHDPLRRRETATRPGAAARHHAVVEERARNADTGALECGRIEKRRVVTIGGWCARFGGRVVRVGHRAFHGAQHDRGIGHRARHGAGGVLIGRDGNDPVPADAPHGGLDPHQHVGVRG